MYSELFGYFLIHTADETPFTPVSTTAELQRHAMYLSIKSNFDKHNDPKSAFEKYIFHNAETDANECTWRGVHCDDAIVTRFVFSATSGNGCGFNWELELSWLPSSLEYTRLSEVVPLSQWAPERLPRALRYLYFWGIPNAQSVSQICSLRSLPNGIEEMHLINSWPGGPVVLIDLPASMRFCSILQWNLRSVYVDNASLSDSLEILNLHVEARAKVIRVGEAQWDPRVNRLGDGVDFFTLIERSETHRRYSVVAEGLRCSLSPYE